MAANPRRASFTVWESGNTFATSGSSTMTLLPDANRFEYFPRTPFEKSYSSRPLPLELVLFFAIVPGFPPSSAPRADDTDILSSLGMDDHYQSPAIRFSQEYESVFGVRVIGIGDGER